MEITLEERQAIATWRRNELRRRLLRFMAGSAILVAAYVGLSRYAFLAVKMTESIEGMVFVVRVGEPVKKNALAMFTPSLELRQMVGCNRWTKFVVGFPGDVISHKGREIFINGHSYGVAIERSPRFKGVLAMIPDGVIPPHFYYVAGTYERSFDSRYQAVGLINEKAFIGRAYRVF